MTLGGVDPRKEPLPLESGPGTAPLRPAPSGAPAAPAPEPAAPAERAPASDAWIGGLTGSQSRMALPHSGPYAPLAQRPDPAEAARAGGRAPVAYEDPAHWQRQEVFQREVLVSALKADSRLGSVLSNWSAMPEPARLAALERVSAKMGEIYGFEPLAVRVDHTPGVSGTHDAADGTIVLSRGAFDDPRQALALVGHMQAHAYQGHVVAQHQAGAALGADHPHHVGAHMGQAAELWAAGRTGAEPEPDSPEAWVARRTRPSENHAWQLGDTVAYQLVS